MLPVRDVLVAVRVDVLLGQAKVYDVDDGLTRCAVATQEEVLWLHVPVYQVFTVHILQSCYLEGGGWRVEGRGGEGRGGEGRRQVIVVTVYLLQ